MNVVVQTLPKLETEFIVVMNDPPILLSHIRFRKAPIPVNYIYENTTLIKVVTINQMVVRLMSSSVGSLGKVTTTMNSAMLSIKRRQYAITDIVISRLEVESQPTNQAMKISKGTKKPPIAVNVSFG